jgi:CRISPR-associated endoribonuclease Cas6
MPTVIDLVIDRHIPGHTPDQLHGLACALLEGDGVDHDSGIKPFTVWPLRQDPDGQVLRLTLLGNDDQSGRPIPDRMRLGSQVFEVRQRRDLFVPFASLVGGPLIRQARLSFETPTYFSRNGRDLPLPDPVLVFRSLLNKWNLHAPDHLDIGEAIARDLLDRVVVLDADVHTLSTEAAHRARRTGFVGTVGFSVGSCSDEIAGAFTALVRAAEYLGVGAQTTRGFGVTIERSV